MTDPKLILYHFPGACSRVTVCALEMAGLAYELELINLFAGKQTEPEYKMISPLGKVPLMMIDGEPMAENLGIITYIEALRPDAGIFPANASPRMRGEAVGGMAFCSGTVHPQIRGITNPQRVTAGDLEGVREKSRELLHKSYAYAQKRLAANGWWLGELSIVDIYLDWTASVARNGGFDMSAYPLVNGLESRLADVPAYARMQAEEKDSRSKLGL